MYAPTVLVVHPDQFTVEELAAALQDYDFHALPLTDAVDAIEHVENLDFDVALVSSHMPSGLPQLLYDSHRGNWLEIIIFNFPKEGMDVADYVRAVNDAVSDSRWTRFDIEIRWKEAWDGDAGYDHSTQLHTEAGRHDETYDELFARVLLHSEDSQAS